MDSGSIHDAAGSGDLDALKKIVEEHPEAVDHDDRHGWRPIFHAGLRRRLEIVRYLIDNGADLAAHDGYVMHYAAEVPDNKDVVSILVAYGGADAHTKPASEVARQFICAVFLANAPRVDAMLRANPRLAHERYARGDTAMHHACRNGDLDVVMRLVSSRRGRQCHVGQRSLSRCTAPPATDTRRQRDSSSKAARIQTRRMADGKTVAAWLKQYAHHDSRMKACLEILAS